MSNIYIGIHHSFYPYQEYECEENAFVSTDLNKVREWCDSFKPVEENDEKCEWRSIKSMSQDKDYCTPSEYNFSVFEVDVPTIYTQE